MPNTKEIPEVGNIYLYEETDTVKSRWERFPFLNYFRRKLNLDSEEVEAKRRAILRKDGKYRVRYNGLSGYRRKYLHDLYISLIDLRWRYAFAVFFNVYLLVFLFFGIMWWIIAYNHGDFDNANNPDWQPCISTVFSFPKCLMFSIETQTTIGYGISYPNTDCDGVLLMVYLQITIGILLDNILLGFIFVKFAQPKRRQKTIIFSKNACVTQHDGEPVVQIRIGDIRKSHLLAAEVYGCLVRRHVSEEGAISPLYLNRMKFTADDMDATLVLMWPMVLTHKITEDSPFWDIKPADLNSEKYEMIVFVEGTIESTGEFCQVRTSYTPNEFLWGHRFDRIEDFDSGNARWEIDFAGFHDVVYTSNIRHSAKELAHFRDKKVVTYTADDEEDEETTKAQIQTKHLKTVSYDINPMHQPRDNTTMRGIRFTLPGQLNTEESRELNDESREQRSSLVSIDEEGYKMADDDNDTSIDSDVHEPRDI